VGYLLKRDQERHHPAHAACFEPTIDYVVCQNPQVAVSKNSPAPIPHSATQMKSVGEVMAIGRTFKAGAVERAAKPRDRVRLSVREAYDRQLIRAEADHADP